MFRSVQTNHTRGENELESHSTGLNNAGYTISLSSAFSILYVQSTEQCTECKVMVAPCLPSTYPAELF